jgi:hypothetical protein
MRRESFAKRGRKPGKLFGFLDSLTTILRVALAALSSVNGGFFGNGHFGYRDEQQV